MFRHLRAVWHPVPRRVAWQRSPACAAILGCLLLSGCAGQSGSAGEGQPTDHRTPITDHPAPAPAPLLTSSSTTIDLGIVPQAGREQETFSLANAGATPVEVARIETSCECLELEPADPIVPPGGKTLVRAKLDLAHEPNFVGGLAIEVKGLTAKGEVAFAVVVEVRVEG